MKVHDEIDAVIDVYLAGGLSPEERKEVEAHAADCATCTSALEDAAAFHSWMKGNAGAYGPTSDLEDRIIANLRSARRPRVKGFKILAGIAALFVFIAIGALVSRSDALTEVQNKLVARSGVAYNEKLGHDQKFIRHTPEMDGYAGDTATEGEVRRGWGSEASGYMGLPTDLAKNYKDDLERARRSITDSIGVGGGGGSAGRFGSRKSESLKNLAQDKAPAPASPKPEEPAEFALETDRDAFAAEKKTGGGEFRKEQTQRPEGGDPVFDDRKIIRNADLHLEVEDYGKAYAKIGEITLAKKGYIAGASTTKLANGKVRATVTLRIPPELFEQTLIELAALGTERHRAISTADVTKQYTDLQSRLKSKETLVERLKKVLLEGKGTVKELMEVEVQMGATIEQIEQIKGELKYYDNLVGMSTITMQVFEKDLGLPFEYVQTLQSVISVKAHDADAAYAGAQKTILDAGGQVVQSTLTRASEDSVTGFVRAKVDADKFPAVRAALRKLGQQIDQDAVNEQRTGRGGQGDAKPGAPVRKEQASIDFTVNTPPILVTRRGHIGLEAAPAESAYHAARKEVEAAGGEILGGSLTDKTGGATAYVRARVDGDKFPALVEKLKSLGKVKTATVKQDEPAAESGNPPLIREKGEVVIEFASPPPLIPEESGLGRVLRETFSRSVAGLLWSFEKLFVGIALAGPWIVLALVVLLIWRRARRKPKPSAASGGPA